MYEKIVMQNQPYTPEQFETMKKYNETMGYKPPPTYLPV